MRDFFYLTKYTSPFGYEQERFGDFFTDLGCVLDPHGNYILHIGESRTMFAAHIDTADRAMVRVRRVVNGDFISTDGMSILGADDRAGIAVLLHLIRNKVPGKYVFFCGEESGRVGSTFAEQDGIADNIDRVICWDRYGEGSIITHQMMERCCSDEFATALGREYERQGVVLAPDNGGTFTDSYSFVGSVPECTNISVGYYQAHTRTESQNARFLVEIAEASVLIDWEGLPVVRDPRDYELMGWTRKDSSQYYSSVSAYSGKTRYTDSDALIQAAQWGILSLKDVSDFLWEDPDGAASLLYDLLRGANLYGHETSS